MRSKTAMVTVSPASADRGKNTGDAMSRLIKIAAAVAVAIGLAAPAHIALLVTTLLY